MSLEICVVTRRRGDHRRWVRAVLKAFSTSKTPELVLDTHLERFRAGEPVLILTANSDLVLDIVFDQKMS